MASFNDPKISNSILSDVNALRALIRSLATMNPASGNTDMPEGSIQFISTSEGMQFRQYNGNAWSAITSKLMHDVDKVDGYDASKTSIAENVIPVYKTGGLIAGGCEGNAGSATKLKTKRTIDVGGIASADAVEFDGSSNITIPINSINVSEDALTGIVPIEHGGTGRNDGAATDVVFSDGGKASEYGQIGSAVNVTGKDLNSLVKSGNYFSTIGTVPQNYPTNLGENIYIVVSEYGVYRKQLLYSENQLWVRDSKNFGASWSSWILLSASREAAFYVYISKSGSDSNSGLTSSSPVLSITRALSIAHKMYPYGQNKSVIFCCGEGEWGSLVLNSLPFVLQFSDYANTSNVVSYSETLPKFTSITANNSCVSIKNSVVDHIISDKSGVIFTDGYLRFSRVTSQNFSEIYISSKTNEIKSMSSQTSVLYTNQRGQIILGATSFKIIDNLNLSIAFAVIYTKAYIFFNNSVFSLGDGVSVTGKRYDISVSGCALASKSYLDSLPGSVDGKLNIGSSVSGIPYGGGASDQALMADLSWKPVLLLSGGTMTGTINSESANAVLQHKSSTVSISDSSRSSTTNVLLCNDLDKNGNRGGGIELSYTQEGERKLYFTMRNRDNSGWLSSFGLVEKVDGSVFINGYTPPDSANGTEVITAAWANKNIGSKLAGYLPLTGGTLSGGLAVGGPSGYNISSIKDGVSHALLLSRNNNNGAYLWLRDNEDKTEAGAFDLTARLGSSVSALLGRPDGQLLWKGKHIVRSINGLGADGNGNVTLNIAGTKVNNAAYADSAGYATSSGSSNVCGHAIVLSGGYYRTPNWGATWFVLMHYRGVNSDGGAGKDNWITATFGPNASIMRQASVSTFYGGICIRMA